LIYLICIKGRGNLPVVITGKAAFVTNSQGLRLWTERFGDPADPVVLLIMGTAAQAIGWPGRDPARPGGREDAQRPPGAAPPHPRAPSRHPALSRGGWPNSRACLSPAA